MIFDCDRVTDLVLEWQDTHDNVVMGEIVSGCRQLVEVIVSTFDSQYRDDLIQESFLKLQYALSQFDPNISNLYNFLATVIKNVCITYVKRQGHSISLEELGELDEHYEIEYDDGIVHDAIIRNRHRFPSIPVEEIDDITDTICIALSSGEKRFNSIISQIVDNFDVDRHIASTVYYSTLIYLRSVMYESVDNSIITDEFSILRDFEEIIGSDIYAKVAVLFRGIHIRVS